MANSKNSLAARAGAMWRSFRQMPGWVQVWVAFVLVPVNAASLLFLGQPAGVWVAVLAFGPVLCNAPVLWVERGFSRTMALSHLLPWTFLVIWLLAARPPGSPEYQVFLSLLLAVNAVSLIFDYRDGVLWWRARAVRKSQQNRS